MKHATTRMIFAYWDALRGERSAPERGEIEPGEIRHVLADTFVLEVAPERIATIRLAGTRICAFFGRELRGESIGSGIRMRPRTCTMRSMPLSRKRPASSPA
jgi:hypothetical protein